MDAAGSSDRQNQAVTTRSLAETTELAAARNEVIDLRLAKAQLETSMQNDGGPSLKPITTEVTAREKALLEAAEAKGELAVVQEKLDKLTAERESMLRLKAGAQARASRPADRAHQGALRGSGGSGAEARGGPERQDPGTGEEARSPGAGAGGGQGHRGQDAGRG